MFRAPPVLPKSVKMSRMSVASMVSVVSIPSREGMLSRDVPRIRATRQHEGQLAKLGMSEVARRRLGWRFWWGGPWGATRLVTATKPECRN